MGVEVTDEDLKAMVQIASHNNKSEVIKFKDFIDFFNYRDWKS